MVDDPQELVLEHLRYIRSHVDTIEKEQRELKFAVLSVKEQVNDVRKDMIRQERAMASVEVDIDRIKVRLDLVDNPNI